MSRFLDERRARKIRSQEDIIVALEITKEIAQAAEFSEMDSVFLQLATEEACMNALEHCEDHMDRDIEVTWLVTSYSMEIAVSQKGRAFEIPLLVESNIESRGRGLALIQGIMDKVSVIPKGAYVTLWMCKDKGK